MTFGKDYKDKTIMKQFAIVTLAVTLITIVGTSFAQEAARLGDLVIEQPWARASIGTNRPAAAYLTIRNEGTEDDALLAVSTPMSGMAEVHTMSMKDGVMSMGPAGPVEIPAGGKVLLAPGGLHIMMMKLKKALIKGKSVEITLSFKRSGKITVTAPIYGPGATRPE